ncbi:DUF4194 domain-containing protein [Halioglobus maricola]|uniref:DUF4194 domain-containing protein n=1 Tax=Halioglobus maricola TaxID=2601894 RepID=A0A5P9NJI5_9GAMM|nr:DUF4194 domain-containing protein [Halioglobus maricola]QFU75927.1 DUF4194 domain-containing protein [Halioglobus maricola]
MITDVIQEALSQSHISNDEFSELVIRLLDHGVITREKSQVETQLYDRYVQCEDLVEDYLSPLKVRIQHDRKFGFIRLFPPGATVSGMPDIEDTPFNGGFRVKPSQQDIATILVLRVEYEKSLREGHVDENGCVLIAMESVAISHKSLLKRPLPEVQGERLAIFKKLRQLRLIDFNLEESIGDKDSWVSIQPSIATFVSDDVLSTLYPIEGAMNNKEPRHVL